MRDYIWPIGIAAVMLGSTSVISAIGNEASMADGGRRDPPGFTDDGIAFNQGGWNYVPTDGHPALLYPSEGAVNFVVSCNDLNIVVVVRGLTPKQSWPQPKMTVNFGNVSRAVIPDLGYEKDRTRFSITFRLVDSVLGAIRDGNGFRAKFDTQQISFPAPPEPMRKDFVKKCIKGIPPALRTG